MTCLPEVYLPLSIKPAGGAQCCFHTAVKEVTANTAEHVSCGGAVQSTLSVLPYLTLKATIGESAGLLPFYR